MLPIVRRSHRFSRLFRLASIGVLALSVSAPFTFADEKLTDLLELRGYTRIGGQIEFSVHNKDEKRSRWLAINKPEDGYTIESYDRDSNEIVIRFNGRRGRLPLAASRVAEWKPETAADGTAVAENGRSSRPGNRSLQRTAPTVSRNTPPLPATLPPASENRSNVRTPSANGAHAGGGFTSGRGNRPPNPDPSNPDPRPNPGSPPAEDDGKHDFSWGDLGEPPPIPTAPPPSYNPPS